MSYKSLGKKTYAPEIRRWANLSFKENESDLQRMAAHDLTEASWELFMNEKGELKERHHLGDVGEVSWNRRPSGFIPIASVHNHVWGGSEPTDQDREAGQAMADVYGVEYHLFVVGGSGDSKGLEMTEHVFYPSKK